MESLPKCKSPFLHQWELLVLVPVPDLGLGVPLRLSCHHS